MKRTLALLVALGGLLWAVAAWGARRRSKGVTVHSGPLVDSDGRVVRGESAAEQALLWSRWLGRVVTVDDFDTIEQEAARNGAPTDWEFVREWPTPCGPPSDPKRYCGG